MPDSESGGRAGGCGTCPREADACLEPQQVLGDRRQAGHIPGKGNRHGYREAWLVGETSLWPEPRKRWRRVDHEAGEEGGLV